MAGGHGVLPERPSPRERLEKAIGELNWALAGLLADSPGEEEVERALVAFLTIQEALDEFVLSWTRERAREQWPLDRERRNGTEWGDEPLLGPAF